MFENMFSHVFLIYFCCLYIVMCEMQLADFNNQILGPDDINTKIQSLRKFMLEDDKLKIMRTDDAFLLRFLHATDFNLDNAQVMVKKFYVYVREEKDWIAVDITDKIKGFLDLHISAMLPAIDRNGSKIFYMRASRMDPSKLTMGEMSQMEGIWYESVLDDSKVQAHGISMLVDAYALPWEVIGWLAPRNVLKYMRKLDNLPNLKHIHIVRASTAINVALFIAWPFIPPIIREKFRFHFNDIDSLVSYISPENIPKESGGTLDVNFETLTTVLLSKSAEIQEKLEHYKRIIAK